MSKRFPNRYAKQPRDFYPTPFVTVEPLIPHLKASRVNEFCDPCAGQGDLVRHLEFFGLRCTYAGDIETGQDALEIEHFDTPPITNPPFSRESTPLLLAIIRHFIARAPCTWLLLPADRINNQNILPFLPHCSDMVVAGRDRWLQNGGTGTTALAWFRFDRMHTSGPVVHHGTAFLPRVANQCCHTCGGVFRPTRADTQYCSSACKQKAYRAKLAVTER
jgi:hypothetical protein